MSKGNLFVSPLVIPRRPRFPHFKFIYRYDVTPAFYLGIVLDREILTNGRKA